MINKRLLSSLIAVPALAFSTAADAEGLYLAISLGGSSYKADHLAKDQDAAIVGAGATGLSSKLDKEDVAFKLQLGYKLNDYLAIEGGYVDLGNAKYAASFAGGSLDVKIRAEGFNLGVLGSVPITKDISVFGKAGVIYAYLSGDGTGSGIAGGASGNESTTGLKASYGFGVDYALDQNWVVRAEYERFSKLGDKEMGKTDVDLMTLGLVVKF